MRTQNVRNAVREPALGIDVAQHLCSRWEEVERAERGVVLRAVCGCAVHKASTR